MSTATATAPAVPSFKWAQNKDVVFLTVETPDAKDVKINLQSKEVSFDCESSGKRYRLRLPLSHEIEADQSRFQVQGRGVELVLAKKESDKSFWSYLPAEHKVWQSLCKVDWSRWVDEDDLEEHDPNEEWKKHIADFNPIDFPDEGMDETEEDENEEDKERI
jgi:prostaglandin-E synthase